MSEQMPTNTLKEAAVRGSTGVSHVPIRRVARSKLLQSALLIVLTVSFLAASESRFERLGHQMICMCGCGQILNECNHVGCPVSPVMLSELRSQLATSSTDTAIFNWFAAKYGAVALASPIRGGFDDVAWVTPLAVFFLATIGTGFTVWLWRRRTVHLAPGGYTPSPEWATRNLGDEAKVLRDRIRQETEYQ